MRAQSLIRTSSRRIANLVVAGWAIAAAAMLAGCGKSTPVKHAFIIDADKMKGFLTLIGRTLDLAGRHAVLPDRVDAKNLQPLCPDQLHTVAVSRTCTLGTGGATVCKQIEDLTACKIVGGVLTADFVATPGDGLTMTLAGGSGVTQYVEGNVKLTGNEVRYSGAIQVTATTTKTTVVDARHYDAIQTTDKGTTSPVVFAAGPDLQGGVFAKFTVVGSADGAQVTVNGTWSGFVVADVGALGTVTATFIDVVFERACSGPKSGKLVVDVVGLGETLEARYTGCNAFDFVHTEGGRDADTPKPIVDPSIFANSITGVAALAGASLNAMPAVFAPFDRAATRPVDWCHMFLPSGAEKPLVVTGPALAAVTTPVAECLAFVPTTATVDVLGILAPVVPTLSRADTVPLLAAVYGQGATVASGSLKFATALTANVATYSTLGSLQTAMAKYAAAPATAPPPFAACEGAGAFPACAPAARAFAVAPSRLGVWLTPAGGNPVLLSNVVGIE